MGAGQIDPVRAPYPGLVYDATELDYIKFLCAQGYNTNYPDPLLRKEQSSFIGEGESPSLVVFRCGTPLALLRVVICGDASLAKLLFSDNLNYPCFALSSSKPNSISGVFNRTATNVGSPRSTYKAKVIGATTGLEIKVNPSILSFLSLGQKLSFQVTGASLLWDDGTFQVRSPIVVYAIYY
ncbi:hypothetical protein PRUPE_2G166200 [Prunus persica]|uniref:Subtilisin-like protease fibronectin type-III domain-containing protein n=1 Tax=Prunus persica TaxID=3760 RepID=M5X5W5_PRUPE|nr:hypothetical protein PRUPE_2G166200 [Prunus persica]